MSNGKRVPYATGKQIADELVAELGSVCERIVIAGSLRREQPEIGDIDLVCIPRTQPGSSAPAQFDMFDQPIPVQQPPEVVVSLLDRRCDDLLARGIFQHRLDVRGQRGWGPLLKKGWYQGVGIDITTATAETWGYWLAVRTGSTEFSHKLVTPRRQGGFCPHHLHFKGGRLRRIDDGSPMDTPDEPALFRALGIAMLAPSARTDTVRPRLLEQV